MNSLRVLVRVLGVIALVVIVLFPPWKASYTTGPERTPGMTSLGYRPLWYRIETDENDTRENIEQRINLIWLGGQLAAALIVTNVALALIPKSKIASRSAS